MMKLYTCSTAPSPLRVTAYLAEKQIEIEQVEINLRQGEHLRPEFAQLNPHCTVPVLQLDDGSTLWDSGAIRIYLEELYPEPPLLGTDARQRAIVAMWQHWVELQGLYAVMNAFRNATPGFEQRALPGQRPVAQIAALAERDRQRYEWFLQDLNGHLRDREFIAGEAFSVADIDARITIDFASRAIKVKPAEDMSQLRRWYRRLAAFRAFENERHPPW